MERDKEVVSEILEEQKDVVEEEIPSEKSFEISDEAKEQSRKFFNFFGSNKKEKRKYESFEIVKTFTPKEKVKKNDEFDKILEVSNDGEVQEEVITLSQNTKNVKPSVKLRPQGKLILCLISIIFILISSVCIYNAVKINSLNNDINNLSNQITIQDLNIDKAIKNVDKLSVDATSTEQAERLDMQKAASVTNVELYEKMEKLEAKEITNWFDRVCNFISKIFGG